MWYNQSIEIKRGRPPASQASLRGRTEAEGERKMGKKMQILECVTENARVQADWRGRYLAESLKEELRLEAYERGLSSDEADDLVQWALTSVPVSSGVTEVVEVVQDEAIPQKIYDILVDEVCTWRGALGLPAEQMRALGLGGPRHLATVYELTESEDEDAEEIGDSMSQRWTYSYNDRKLYVF